MAQKALHNNAYKISNDNEMNTLIECLYNNSCIDHVEYKDKNYYEGVAYDDDVPEHKLWNDETCKGDICEWECFEPYRVLYPDDIKYIMRINNHIVVDEELGYDNLDFVEEIVNQHNDVGCKIILCGYDSIVFKNLSGINSDHRGETKCFIELPLHDEYKIDLPCDLETFAEAIHKIKSHKWDYWYELFGACVKFEEIDNILYVDLTFDHGS